MKSLLLVILLIVCTPAIADTKALMVVTTLCDKIELVFGTGAGGEVEGYIQDFTRADIDVFNSIMAEIEAGNGKTQIISSRLTCASND